MRAAHPQLYGLYKVLTISPEPQTSRPSIFDLTGRAKWDAWKNAGLKWRGNELEAEKHYIEIAKGLGWTFNNSGLVITEILDAEELSAEELLARDSFEDDTSPKGSGGLGLGVSTMQRCSPVSSEEPTLHTLAIDGDLPKLQKFLEEHPNVELNDVDEFVSKAHKYCFNMLLNHTRDTLPFILLLIEEMNLWSASYWKGM